MNNKLSIIIVSIASLLLMNESALAQNIAVNSTGTAANASSMLDIAAGAGNNKGLLIPRVTLAQRTAMNPLPIAAQGLIVYQTDGVQGFYYNTSVGVVPAWSYLTPGGWSITGNAATVASTSAIGVAVNNNFLGTTDNITLVFATNNLERMRILNTGFVGVNTLVPRGLMHIDGGAAAASYRITNTTTANAAATDGFKIEIPAAASSVLISNQENANIQFNTNNLFRGVYFNDGTYWHGGSAATGFDADEFDGPTGLVAGVGSVWGLSIAPAANGTGYGTATINYSVLGMVAGTRQYSMGVAGQTVDVNRCGAVFGMSGGATQWGTLGYRSSAAAQFGAYFSAVAGNGAGFLSSSATSGVGTGTYSDFLGSIINSQVIGQITIGELMASYNLGNEYTSGYKADIVKGANGKSVAFSNSSTELKIYSDGSASLSSGEHFVQFEESFINMYSKESIPTITVSAMGECNGLYISKVEQNGFWVRELNNGNSNVLFSWIAIGKRIDKVEVPSDIMDTEFDTNLKNFIVDENNPAIEGKPMWWNGSKIVFNQEAPKAKPVGRLKTVAERTQGEFIPTRPTK